MTYGMTAPPNSRFIAEDGTPFVVGEPLPTQFGAPGLTIVSLHVVEDGIGYPEAHVEIIALHNTFYEFVSQVLRDGGGSVLTAYLMSAPKLQAAKTPEERDAVTAEAFGGFDIEQQSMARDFAVQMQKIGQAGAQQIRAALQRYPAAQQTQANLDMLQRKQERELREALVLRLPLKGWRSFESRIVLEDAIDLADTRLMNEAAYGGQTPSSDEGSEGGEGAAAGATPGAPKTT